MRLTHNRGNGRHHVHEVEVRLQTLEQFFNSMDPSPFYDKDLDPDAEHYIVSWAEEFPLHEPVRLVLHLDTGEVDEKLQATVEKAVHSHFSNQARLARVEFRRLMRVGSRSLAIGLAVLAACLLGGELLTKYNGPVFEILRQSLLIGGWVAMWHPMQIYLHSWWPLRRRWRVYQKLARMGVEVRATRRVENPAPVASR